MHLRKSALALAVAIGMVLAVWAEAQTLPPGVFAAEIDFALATAGSYSLDDSHTAAMEKSTLEVSVERASITSNVSGKVEGNFTLMGKTKPVFFDVTLIGAGKGFSSKPRLGVTAVASINPQDFGLSPFFADPIQIVVDIEFEKQS